ncbi:glycohydrolase toxin TNT-related protein [Schaalia sp. Marseille-Q2122]|uniref:glycohydrolase toxin TNT-related protein n=1 Tax=Schaalia sp. Marseille-Q2122 TaxID=2736604 RepID=UPI00158C26FD|nr:glycohydrolase toxin TNT-related protein [Schaalia sp. Marseille-Q2122]
MALVEDVGEVLGRDQYGNLRSYNQWWDETIGRNKIWPEDGEKLPVEVRIPEGAKLAPGVNEPTQYTIWGGAFKESVIDWGGDKARSLAEGIVHQEGSRNDLLAAFKAHYDLPSEGAIYFDRVGEPNGGFLGLIGPDGPASFGERSLNPSSLHKTYYAYQLIEDNIPDDYTIRSGITAPYHGGQGGAVQLQIFNSHGDEVKVEKLIIDGVLRKVI